MPAKEDPLKHFSYRGAHACHAGSEAFWPIVLVRIALQLKALRSHIQALSLKFMCSYMHCYFS